MYGRLPYTSMEKISGIAGLEARLPAIAVVNKIDRQDARPEEVVDEIYELFIDLDATDEQIEFPILYAISRDGVAKKNLTDDSNNLRPLFDQIVETIPAPRALRTDALQLLVANLDYNEYVGRLAIGRIFSGEIATGDTVAIIRRDGTQTKTRVSQLYIFEGLKREAVERADVGEIVALAGLEEIEIGETITSADNPHALPVIAVDEPTISMIFGVNNSPFAGLEGKYVPVKEAVSGFTEILEGKYDHIREDFFYMKGNINEVVESYEKEQQKG